MVVVGVSNRIEVWAKEKWQEFYESSRSSFEEIAEMSKQHGMEMFQQGDEEHLKAMNQMQDLMKNPDAMKEWFETKRKEFDALPGD